MSLLRVFVLLLIPWLVMGIVAALAFMARLPDWLAIVLALVAALAVTYYVREFVITKRVR